MREKLNKLRKNLLVEISQSTGFSPIPSTTGTIVTTEKKKYYYYKDLRKNEITISKSTDVSDDVYQKLQKYVDKINNQEFERILIMDFSSKVITKEKQINNHMEVNNMISKILKGDKK